MKSLEQMRDTSLETKNGATSNLWGESTILQTIHSYLYVAIKLNLVVLWVAFLQ